ncbi:hypothetical protein J2P12_00685, partial [Candidatus Bathyarchaeota archaeon]|nr:hypothetical protein [Candidatus Bathyarchaeota archaeon]
GGTPGQLQYNNNNTSFAGLTNVALGSVLTSPGTSGIPPVWQSKPVYDIRDFASCNTPIGTTGGSDVTSAIQALLGSIGTNQATIRILGANNPTDSCLVSTLSFPPNVTLDFSGGGSFTLVTTVTPTGGAQLDGSPVGTANSSTTSCQVTLNVPTAGDTVALFEVNKFATGGGMGLPTDSKGNVYRQVSASNASTNHYQSNGFAWVASNVAAGSLTITIPYIAATNNLCGAAAFKGLGPSVGADGLGVSCFDHCSTANPMTTFTGATYTAGSLLIAFGGEGTTTQTCTPQGGFTGGLNIGTNKNLCMEYQLSAAGGSVTATEGITTPFVGDNWIFNSFGLKPVKATVFIQGGIVDANLHQIFYQAGPGQGTIDFTGATILDNVYPEWWGAGTNATPTVNTAALQAAINGAFGTNRTNGSGLTIYNRPLYLTGQYQINDELQWYHTIGAKVVCANRLTSGIVQTGVNKRIIDGQSNAYMAFYDCLWSTTASQTTPLIDLDYNQSQGTDLAPQFIDFYHNTFVGNSVADVGVLIAKSGGGAQGSNIYCHDCESIGFTGAAWQVGGNNTGRNAGRSYAQNALDIGYTGDIQGCTLYGIAVYGGGYVGFGSAEKMSSMENGFTNQSGYDMYCEATQGPCTMEHVRTESRKLIAGSWLQIKDSHVSLQALNPNAGSTTGSSSLIYTGNNVTGDGAYYQETTPGTLGGYGFSHASSGTTTTLVDTNQWITGTNTSGVGVTFSPGETLTQAGTGATATLIQLGAVLNVTALEVSGVAGGPNNSGVWTGGTSGGTFAPTATPANVNWTVNGFTGMLVGILSGTNSLCYGTIASNTANTLTIGSWITKYPQTFCTQPDSTSTFVIEPNWNHGAVTDGTAVLTYLNEDTIGPSAGGSGFIGSLEDVSIFGGKINAWTFAPAGITMKHVIVSRTDWLDNSNPQQGQFSSQDRDWDVRVYLKTGVISGAQQTPINWQYSSTTGTSYFGSLHEDWGTKPLCWNTGTINSSGPPGNVSANEVCVGGRSDPTSSNDTFRGRFEIPTMLGAPAPVPNAANGYSLLNQGGVETKIGGGSSSGTGTPGSIGIYIGTTSGSGSTVNSGTRRWLFDGATGHLFANADNTNDIGASAANRPRTIYAATSVVTPSTQITGVNGGFSGTEGTGASVPAGAGVDVMWPDSTNHRWMMNNNNGGAQKIYGSGDFTITSLTDAPGAITVNAQTCTDRSVAMPTILATATVSLSASYALDANISLGPARAETGVGAHYRLCNPTGGNITLNAAAAFNIKVIQ